MTDKPDLMDLMPDEPKLPTLDLDSMVEEVCSLTGAEGCWEVDCGTCRLTMIYARTHPEEATRAWRDVIEPLFGRLEDLVRRQERAQM